MARGVRDDELAARRGEVTVSDIDGDALLTFGAEAVGQIGEIDLSAAGDVGGAFQRFDLILHQRFRIVEQTADERGLSVVDGAAGVEAENIDRKETVRRWLTNGWIGDRQTRSLRIRGANGTVASIRNTRLSSGLPSRLRTTLSSAREPRSVTRAAAISAMMSSTVIAGDSTIPVLMMSPMVRTRTTRSLTSSLGFGGDELVDRQPLACRVGRICAMAEIDARHFEFLALDVFPHVHLGPVAERKHAHVFAGIEAGVVKIPDFRPLILRIPLAEAVAETEEALLRAGFFLVASRAADAAVEPKFLDRREQGGNLQAIAADLAGSRQWRCLWRWRLPRCGRSVWRRVPSRAGRGIR